MAQSLTGLQIPDIIIIGASTGGPKAIEDLALGLQKDLPFVIVAAIHFPAGQFTKILSNTISTKSNINVKVAEHGEILKKGNLYICPGGRHIELTVDGKSKHFISHILDRPSVDGRKPSIDHFFISTAFMDQISVVGIILTGMGDDGLKGCKALQLKGHTVIAQALDSCVAKTMPNHVISSSLSDRIYSITEITSFINHANKRVGILKSGKIKANTKYRPSPKLPRVSTPIKLVPTSAQSSREAPRFSDQDYDQFKKLAIDETGNITFQERRELLEKKLKNILLQYRMNTYAELYEQCLSNRQILQLVLDELTIHESYFFRDKYPFHFFKTKFLLDMQRKNKSLIRVWSACCADGQEPYSIAMDFCSHLKMDTLSIFNHESLEITATDIAQNCLNKTNSGIYSRFEVSRGITPDLLKLYFIKTKTEDYQLKPIVSSKVNVQKVNLCDSTYLLPSFDIIFCRYVLIYMEQDLRTKVISQMLKHLHQGGYFVTDPASSLRIKHPKLHPITFSGHTIHKKI